MTKKTKTMKDLMIDKMNEDKKYDNLSADDPCPDCGKLSNEDGECLCDPPNPQDDMIY